MRKGILPQMITRFSTLYVGHIELEGCGLAGPPADDRRYPNERLIEVFDTAAALAQPTERVKIGCAFNVVPAWHPLRLAEDYAVADILTGGRVVFGVGRGYHSREVETLGAPLLDNDANRELFEESMEVILKAFEQDSFSHHGKHFQIPPPVGYRGYELTEI